MLWNFNVSDFEIIDVEVAIMRIVLLEKNLEIVHNCSNDIWELLIAGVRIENIKAVVNKIGHYVYPLLV